VKGENRSGIENGGPKAAGEMKAEGNGAGESG